MRRATCIGIGVLGVCLLALAVWDQLVRDLEYRTWRGDVFGLPYDLRAPTLARVKQRLWAPDEARLWGPHVFGVGWSPNIGRMLLEMRRRARL
jgi:hypothetical protein